MKNIKQYALACMALLMMSSCNKDNQEDEGQAYKQEVTMPSEASEQMVTLYSLSSSIEMVKNTASWLVVEQQSYMSGAPQVVLSSTDNKDKKERKCTVTITATTGDKVVLAVTQLGTGQLPTGIDDSHDIPTDQPAFSR